MDGITTLVEQFENYDALKKYSAAQYRTIEDLKKKNAALQDELVHLKRLLSQTTAIVGEPLVEKFIVSREQAMCEIQIERMEKTAREREFTLEETRRFEILVKTLHLIRDGGESTVTLDVGSHVSVEHLEAIASLPDDGQ